MPVYTYRCESCGVQFDYTQKFTDEPLKRCPECNKKALRKVYTPVGVVFKGSGFYATDHRSPSGMKYANKSTDDKSEPSESKSEVKPKESSPSDSKASTKKSE